MSVLKRSVTLIALFILAISFPFFLTQSNRTSTDDVPSFLIKILVGVLLFLFMMYLQTHTSWQFGMYKVINEVRTVKNLPKLRKKIATNFLHIVVTSLLVFFFCFLYQGTLATGLLLVGSSYVAGYLDYKFFLVHSVAIKAKQMGKD